MGLDQYSKAELQSMLTAEELRNEQLQIELSRFKAAHERQDRIAELESGAYEKPPPGDCVSDGHGACSVPSHQCSTNGNEMRRLDVAGAEARRERDEWKSRYRNMQEAVATDCGQTDTRIAVLEHELEALKAERNDYRDTLIESGMRRGRLEAKTVTYENALELLRRHFNSVQGWLCALDNPHGRLPQQYWDKLVRDPWEMADAALKKAQDREPRGLLEYVWPSLGPKQRAAVLALRDENGQPLVSESNLPKGEHA